MVDIQKLPARLTQLGGKMKRIITEMPMIMPNQLGRSLRILLNDLSEKSFEVTIQEFDENGKLIDEPGSLIAVMLKNNQKGCPDGTYEIIHSDAVTGYGPLIYDIAIEWSSIVGEGIMSDRQSVSSDAQNVWMKYFNDRSDVIKIPLPATCEDPVAGTFRYGSPVPSTWSIHRYKKESIPVISQLNALGKIKIKVDFKDFDLNNLRR